jgi:hypothetical protein
LLGEVVLVNKHKPTLTAQVAQRFIASSALPSNIKKVVILGMAVFISSKLSRGAGLE